MRVALLLTAAFLAICAPAAARTTIEAPGDAFPYQRWVDESAVPTPEATIRVQESTASCSEVALGCAGMLEIGLAPDLGWYRERVFLHELGHEFALLHPELASFYNERFADSYALCAIGGIVARWSYSVGSGVFSGRRLLKVCRLIRRAA